MSNAGNRRAPTRGPPTLLTRQWWRPCNRRRSILSFWAAAALCASISARSDPPPPSAPATTDALPPPSEVTVDTTPVALARRIEAFVRVITHMPGSSDDESLVRWHSAICPLVVGFRTEDAKRVSDRLANISAAIGAPLARASCQPNFIVVATDQPDRVLVAWHARNRQLFGDATTAQIEQFLAGSRSRPLRVWYNIDWGRKSGTHNGHFVPSDSRAESSVFIRHAPSDFLSVFAVIDTERTKHACLDELADYIAMAGLTRVDLDADIGAAPTILQQSAFAHGQSRIGLSNWDTAFLRALYQSDQTSRNQRFDVEARMIKDITR